MPRADEAPSELTPASARVYAVEGICEGFVQRTLNIPGVLLCPSGTAAGLIDPELQPMLEITDGEGAVLFLTDGRTATERANACGKPNTLVLDLAHDYQTSTRVAVAAADQCSPRARAAMVGLLQAAGWQVTVLDDVPGLAVMRTVCMLANEAADAVHQGVCDPAAVDVAMQKGVNYPAGPIDWARRIGLPTVCGVLRNLQRAYGEDRYRTSAWLRRQAAATA